MVKWYLIGSCTTFFMGATIQAGSGWRWLAVAVYVACIMVAGFSETEQALEKGDD